MTVREHGVLEPAKKFEERYNLGILKVATMQTKEWTDTSKTI